VGLLLLPTGCLRGMAEGACMNAKDV